MKNFAINMLLKRVLPLALTGAGGFLLAESPSTFNAFCGAL